jgi:hypothetical protein
VPRLRRSQRDDNPLAVAPVDPTAHDRVVSGGRNPANRLYSASSIGLRNPWSIDGEVAYVDGEHIKSWLLGRPADLRDERKRKAVQDWLAALPRA